MNKYQDGLYYYQVSKDVATNFFINYLNSGNYVFEYQLRVTQPGNFSTGITSVQSMYAPEFNAHSNGERITIRP
ncbi:MAG: alpha-2-macroglobulin family protein [Mucilaginibacter sp.]